MTGRRQNAASTVIPAMLYHDVAGATDWLCEVIGFEKHRVEVNEDGVVEYAELSFGDSLIMVGSVRDPDYSRFMILPDQASGSVTQTCYLIVDDLDALYARVQAADARIVLDLSHDGRGERCFSCSGFEGHIWSFGTYSPLGIVHGQGKQRSHSDDVSKVKRQHSSALVGMFALFALLVIGAGWFVLGNGQQFSGASGPMVSVVQSLEKQTMLVGEREPSAGQIQLIGLRNDLQTNNDEMARLKERLAVERDAGKAVEIQLQETQNKLKQAEAEKNTALQAAKEASAQLHAAQTDKGAVERINEELRKQLAPIRKSKELADASVAQLRAQLIAARNAGEEAKRAVQDAKSKLAQVEKEKNAALDAGKKVDAHLFAAQTDKAAAERGSRELRKQLVLMRKARKLAEVSAMAIKAELKMAQQADVETKRQLKTTRLRLSALVAANQEIRSSARIANERILALQTDKKEMEQASSIARKQLAQLHRAQKTIKNDAQELQARLQSAESERDTAKRAMLDAQSKLVQVRLEKETALRTVKELSVRLPAVRKASRQPKGLKAIPSGKVSSEMVSHWAKEEKARLEVMNRLAHLTEEVAEISPPVPVISPPQADEGNNEKSKQRSWLARPCASAVQGKIPVSHGGSTRWDAARLARLCRGAGSSAEPAKCFAKLMSGAIWWGAGNVWSTPNAFALCAGTKRANGTINCFKRNIEQGKTWREAISRCRAPSQHVTRGDVVRSEGRTKPVSRN